MLLVELYRPNHAIFYPDGKTDDALEAVNKEHGWNEFIRQILIRLHENKVKRVAQARSWPWVIMHPWRTKPFKEFC